MLQTIGEWRMLNTDKWSMLQPKEEGYCQLENVTANHSMLHPPGVCYWSMIRPTGVSHSQLEYVTDN